MKKETKTRQLLKRTITNYKKSPTAGRLLAIRRYETHLKWNSLLKLVNANPDMCMTMRQVLDYLYGDGYLR